MASPTPSAPGAIEQPGVLYLSVGIIAVCGIVYELIIGSASSYLLGDSVWQFSVTIGLYLSAMGLGSWLSQHLKRGLFGMFLGLELAIGLVGGTSALLLFWGYALSPELYPVLQYGLTLAIGAMVGLEIPILLRLLENRHDLRYNAAYVLSLDYIGGLAGSLAFPLLLLPQLGLIKTALLIGLLNTAVVILGLWRYAGRYLGTRQAFGVGVALSFLALGGAFLQAGEAEEVLEQSLYRDTIIHAAQTPYQHLTVTRDGQDVRLFINGNLQYSSLDEYRYHEALIHVPISRLGAVPRDVLILGGGDGLAARELFKYPQVRAVHLVDLDPAMVELHRTHPTLTALNQHSLRDPRMHVHHLDALKFLEQSHERFDLIVIDLPDPNAEALTKLYTREFYRLAGARLHAGGCFVVQASSPYFAREAFWCIEKTVAAAGLATLAYHLDVPSFGDWGFVMGSPRVLPGTGYAERVKTSYLTKAIVPGMFRFGGDEDGSVKPKLAINTVFNPVLLRYYQQGWGKER